MRFGSNAAVFAELDSGMMCVLHSPRWKYISVVLIYLHDNCYKCIQLDKSCISQTIDNVTVNLKTISINNEICDKLATLNEVYF